MQSQQLKAIEKEFWNKVCFEMGIDYFEECKKLNLKKPQKGAGSNG